LALAAVALPGCGAGEARPGKPTCTHSPSEAGVSGESVDPSELTVVDGDSLLLGDEKIRILGVDAPECPSDYYKGSQEPHASQAKDFVKELIAGAKSACIVRLDTKDKYHRTLAYVFLDERNVSAELVREGLAYENLTFYGHQSLKPYAMEVMDAVKVGKKPEFEAPHLFRRRNALRKRE
jgi:endonuclease YncB( thermonuclease family)